MGTSCESDALRRLGVTGQAIPWRGMTEVLTAGWLGDSTLTHSKLNCQVLPHGGHNRAL